jgi:hypothetical protein
MAGWVAAAVVGSSLLSSQASKKAASTSAQATTQAADTSAAAQREMFERQVELQEPWRQAGISALNKLAPLAEQYTPFGMQQFQADPGYAFRLSEGMKALDRSAAARGNLLSGATLRGAQRFGQDLASQEYMNAFNRYQAERAARLGPLQSLAGVGQTSAQALGAQAGMLGANLGQNYLTSGMQAGQARASGYLGQANALSGGLGSYLNYSQNQALLNRLTPSGGGFGGTPITPQDVNYLDQFS